MHPPKLINTPAILTTSPALNIAGVYATPAMFSAGDATLFAGAAGIVAAAALQITGGAMKNAGEFTDPG
jgi:hypothetical protein